MARDMKKLNVVSGLKGCSNFKNHILAEQPLAGLFLARGDLSTSSCMSHFLPSPVKHISSSRATWSQR